MNTVQLRRARAAAPDVTSLAAYGMHGPTLPAVLPQLKMRTPTPIAPIISCVHGLSDLAALPTQPLPPGFGDVVTDPLVQLRDTYRVMPRTGR